MGLVKKISIEEYWNTTLPSQSSKWFKKVMSRNRFQIILRSYMFPTMQEMLPDS